MITKVVRENQELRQRNEVEKAARLSLEAKEKELEKEK